MGLLGVIVGCGFCYLGWWLWPTDVTKVALASLTLEMLTSAAGSALMWFIGALLVYIATADAFGG